VKRGRERRFQHYEKKQTKRFFREDMVSGCEHTLAAPGYLTSIRIKGDINRLFVLEY